MADGGDAVKMVITPTMAKAMLEKAHLNRPIRTNLLRRLVSDIKSGDWRVTGETIIFDDDGQLTDGQHRLRACIEAGKPITSYVVLGGIDVDAILFTDTGVARSPGDALHMLDHSSANLLAATCRWIHRYETGTMAYKITTLSRGELISMVDKHKQIPESFTYGRRVSKFMTISLGSALHYLMAESDRDKANAFFDELAFGSNGTESSAITLREKFITTNRRLAKHPEHYIAAWTIKAWNLYKGGKSAKIINWYPDSPSRPEPFPVIR